MSRLQSITCISNETYENEETTCINWTPKMTKLLINSVKDMEYELEDNKTRKVMFWDDIRKLMHVYGYCNVSAKNCKDKYGNLKKKFGLEKRMQNKSGSVPSDWEFFDVMNEILGGKPEYAPVSIVSNIGGVEILKENNKKKKVDCTSSTHNISTEKCFEDKNSDMIQFEEDKLNKSIVDRKIKRRKRDRTQMENKLELIRQDRANQFEKAYNQRERFINVLEKFIDRMGNNHDKN